MAASGGCNDGESTPLISSTWISAPVRVLIVTCIAAVAEGYDLGIINGLLVRVEDAMNLTTLQVSLLVGSPQIVAAVASMVSGTLADHYLGRKLSVAMAMAHIMLGSFVMALAPNFIVLLCGRLIIFVGVGVAITTVTTYLSEVAPAPQRGFYGSLQDCAINAGILISMLTASALVGLKSDWRVMAGIGGVLPAIATIILLTDIVPESPRYLMMKGEHRMAKELLLELSGGNTDEVTETLAAWEAEKMNVEAFTWSEAFRAFVTTHSRAAIAGMGVAVIASACCQSAVVSVYSTYILKHYADMADAEAIQMSTIIGTVKFVAMSFTCFYALDAWGRRPLMLFTCAAGAAAFWACSFSVHVDVPQMWIVLLLCIIAAVYGGGLGPVTYAYVSEVFETKIRAKGTATSFCLSRLVQGLISFLIPYALEAETPGGTFVVMALLNFAFTAILFQFCPETKQRTLEQLKSSFSHPDCQDEETSPLCPKA